jgi:DNA-directed RNA polymerase subunit alpha
MSMGIDLTGMVRPHVVEMTKLEDNPNIAEFLLQPLERGFGHTLGNALRRMLLSSLSGSAVWGFRLDGVLHEHQTVQGVLEDVHQIVQRLKSLTLVLADGVDEAVLRIKKQGPGPVTAGDIIDSGEARIISPDHLLFTVQDDREVTCELYVNKGRGYVESEMHPMDRSYPVDLVRIDAIYNPVRRANFTVSETRVGQRTDYDRLAVSVETDGTISPEDAVAYAAALAMEHFRSFVDFGVVPQVADPEPEPAVPAAASASAPSSGLKARLERSIEDLGLSVRSVNSLKNSNIRTLKDLVMLSGEALFKVKNVGEKALTEIAEMLEKEELNFGMTFEEVDGDLRVVDLGTAPMVVAASFAEEN